MPLPVSNAGLVMSMGMMTEQSAKVETVASDAEDDVDPGPGDGISLPKSSCSNLASVEQTQFDMDKKIY